MRRLALALGMMLCAGAAHAQYAGVRVVNTCGSEAPWSPLQTNYGTMAVWLSVDTHMTLCTIGGGGGGGGGLSVTDSAPWTAASSQFTPSGGEYNPSAAALTAGQQGTVALDANRNMMVNGGVVQADIVPSVGSPLQAQANSASDVQLVAATASKSVHVTGWTCVVDGAAAAAGACQLVQGTGTNCATGKANLSFKYTYAAGQGHAFGSNLGNYTIGAVSQAVCAEFSTTNLTTITVQAHVQ